MASAPSVSIVIPAYNSAATIERALQSAIGQTYTPYNIIVVDDRSTDSTRSIVQRYESAGVQLIPLEHRLGAGGARNSGIKMATGELVAFLDSDDEWLPTKLQEQVDLIRQFPEASFVACASNLISSSGEDLGDLYKDHPVTTGSEAWKALLAFNFIATPTVLARRELLIELSGFNEHLKIGEDQDLWIRLAMVGELAYVHRSLVRVHARHNSLSAWSLADLLTYTLPMIERHVVQQRSRLTEKERRRILGERLGRLGRVAYAHGEVRTGIQLIGRSLLLGYQPLESFYYLATAAPPVMWIKRQLRIGLLA